MKRFLLLCVVLLSTSARADELADANKLMEAKSYPQALALYAKLAQQGNAAAQFHLGEMYWYGEAGKVDMAEAAAWYRKAAAAGSKEAETALATMRTHDARAKDIAYWTDNYDGAALGGGKARCNDPAIPPVSKDNAAIKVVSDRYELWSACYRAQVAKLSEPPAKYIPADLAAVMNQQEYDRAVVRIDQAHARVAGDTATQAKVVLASYETWQAATRTYVDEQNKLIKLVAERDSQRRMDSMREAATRVGPPPVVRK